MQILNKITVKGVCGDLDGAVTESKPNLNIAQIIGVVKDKEEVKGQYGTSYRLKGEFKAKNLVTKEDFYSANCFLPGMAEDLVVNQMDPAGANELQFAFIIGIKFSKASKTNYEFTVQPLIKPAENSALTMIESQIKTGTGIGGPSALDAADAHMNQ